MDLQAAVAELDPRDRELIALRYGADLSARQIAELLELKTNAVEVALHRALRKLREQLAAPISLDRGVRNHAIPLVNDE
jgi:RNA polymerase sigma-70 factor (ECF subfamily)